MIGGDAGLELIQAQRMEARKLENDRRSNENDLRSKMLDERLERQGMSLKGESMWSLIGKKLAAVRSVVIVIVALVGAIVTGVLQYESVRARLTGIEQTQDYMFETLIYHGKMIRHVARSESGPVPGKPELLEDMEKARLRARE